VMGSVVERVCPSFNRSKYCSDRNLAMKVLYQSSIEYQPIQSARLLWNDPVEFGNPLNSG
jgi:hypothetical protein